MKILVLNSGSSSLKFQLFTMEPSVGMEPSADMQPSADIQPSADMQPSAEKQCHLLASGLIEQIGETQGSAHFEYQTRTQQVEKIKQECSTADHQQALELMIKELKEKQCINSITELAGIGHRVVHGGEEFSDPIIIDKQVINTIEKLIPLAPLHNPANLTGIKLARQRAPQIPQVAVFDTSFHQTIPEQAYIYALPYSLYEKHKIRRYGFHGTSHHYVAKQASTYLENKLQKNRASLKLISIHLGNGTSAAAIENGKSIDTSMGMTPLEGLVMGTRSGDIDPAILFYLHRETGMSFDELDMLLNKQSGLKGICGQNDMRTIVELAEQGDSKAELAIHIFCYHIKKYIGAYLAVLNGADAIIFTGGIGENSSLIRALSCRNMENLGIEVQPSRNNQHSKNIMEIQTDSSPIKILVIATNEELEIAEQTIKLVSAHPKIGE